MDDEKYRKLLDYALKLLSFRPRSKRELLIKLKQYINSKKIQPELIMRVSDYLIEQKFLDDEEFCRWWIDQRLSFRPKGFQLIRMELINKGIERELIEKVFSESQNRSEDELLMARRILDKKAVHLKNFPREEKKAKMSQMLARHGFKWDVISKAVDDFLKKA